MKSRAKLDKPGGFLKACPSVNNKTCFIIHRNIFMALLATACAVLVLLAGCSKGEERKPTAIPAVTVEEVKLSAVDYTIRTTGLVHPWKEARLSFQVPGKISQGPPEEGSTASAGTVLSKLDDAEYLAQIEYARHELELARVEVERTRSDLERLEQLYAQDAIPEKDLEDARFAHRAAKARAGQAESALRRAELSLAHSSLKAPFSGEVLKKLCEEGEMVAAGTPVLVLAQLNPVKISVTVPASELNAWPEGSEVSVKTNASPALPGNKSKNIKAVVHNVSPSAEGYTGSFEVLLKADNPEYDLRPGQVVDVERQVKTGQALWIPLKSVVSRGEELKYVFVYNSSKSTAEQRAVTLGMVAGDRVRVLSGLEAGELVLVMMPSNLKDGARVEVRTSGAN